MKNLVKYMILFLLVLALAVLQFYRFQQNVQASISTGDQTDGTAPIASPALTFTPASSGFPVSTPSPTPTPISTPISTPEPTPELFTISVIGDETLANRNGLSDESQYSFGWWMKGDYSYPFKNTSQYFLDDELTITNLECTFADQQIFSDQQFNFRAPTANAQILVEGGVEFVTTANNHALDFGQAGLQATQTALEEHGIAYGTEDSYQIFTTEHGLRIGIYCAGNDMAPSEDKATSAIQMLKAENVDYIVCCFHWGQELKAVNDNQVRVGRACIDAGANLIFGCHPHCLQPIEEYNGGIILYSMGEFSFGGHTAPSDRDTAIFQVLLKRDLDGSISVDSWKVIPCCVSSRPVYEGYTLDNYNDYCPTPYEEGSEDYNRVVGKLDGSYTAHYTGTDYSNWYSSYG